MKTVATLSTVSHQNLMKMKPPIVSFVVPCYKLGHLLSVCVNSLLSQTFKDFEIIIMDDCSPDDTPQIAKSFADPRIKYMRNECNIGALPNYNKGIKFSKGKYVWLISADDYLRSPHILDRYVSLLENNFNVGYCFCPGIRVRGGKEMSLINYSYFGNKNKIVPGHKFIESLVSGNIVLAASAMARRECYDKISYFPVDVEWARMPIDLIWGGDWFLWLIFALDYDVAYFSEPMVCYREHDLSATNAITRQRLAMCWASELAVLWMVSQKAQKKNLSHLSDIFLRAIGRHYAAHITNKNYYWVDYVAQSRVPIADVMQSIKASTNDRRVQRSIDGYMYEELADTGAEKMADKFIYYIKSIKYAPLRSRVYAKIILSLLGPVGAWLRKLARVHLKPLLN